MSQAALIFCKQAPYHWSRRARCASATPTSSKVMASRERSSQPAKKLPEAHALSPCRASFSRRIRSDQEATCPIVEGHLVHSLSRTWPVLIRAYRSRLFMTRVVHDRVLAFWYLFDLGYVRRKRRNEDVHHHHIGDGLMLAKVSVAAKIAHIGWLG